MDRGVQCVGRCLRESQTDTKIVSLQAMAHLIQLKVVIFLPEDKNGHSLIK